MKANELRIGNWYDDNGVQKQVTPSTIEEVWNAERSWCKPISLTEKWLVKFRLMSIKTELGFWNNGDAIYFSYGFEKSIELKYVHQLQNLYFALTGEELTIGGQDE
jgi:hypothetical protein